MQSIIKKYRNDVKNFLIDRSDFSRYYSFKCDNVISYAQKFGAFDPSRIFREKRPVALSPAVLLSNLLDFIFQSMSSETFRPKEHGRRV